MEAGRLSSGWHDDVAGLCCRCGNVVPVACQDHTSRFGDGHRINGRPPARWYTRPGVPDLDVRVLSGH